MYIHMDWCDELSERLVPAMVEFGIWIRVRLCALRELQSDHGQNRCNLLIISFYLISHHVITKYSFYKDSNQPTRPGYNG